MGRPGSRAQRCVSPSSLDVNGAAGTAGHLDMVGHICSHALCAKGAPTKHPHSEQ